MNGFNECVILWTDADDMFPGVQLSKAGAPGGLFYDTDWGGLPSRVGYNATWHSKPATRCSV